MPAYLSSRDAGPRARLEVSLAYAELTPASIVEVEAILDEPQSTHQSVIEHKKLERTAIQGTLWTVGAYGATQALRFGNNIILTHLLQPQFFGLMALVSTLVMGLTLLSDVGLLPSVINSPRGDDPIFLNTAWSLQAVRGAFLWVISLVIAWPLSNFYHDARIQVLLPVLGLSMIANGFASTNLLRVARHIGVRRLLLLELSTQTFGILLTILVAWRFPSVWALVIGTLVAAAAKSVLSHFPNILPGPPNSFAWDADCARSLVSFGKWVFLGTAFYFFGVQADRLILGKLVSFTILGVYNIAFTVSDIPRQVIQQFSFRIALPFIARMQHLPRDEFRKRVLRYRFFALAAGAFILATVVVCGGPLVVALYDARYQSAQWIVPILALGLWHTLLYNTTGNILFAIGKPAYNAIGTGLFCGSMYLALPVAFHFFGLRGAVISIAAGDLPLYFTLAIGAAREKVGLWVQDALATLLFLALLLSGYAIRSAFVGHFTLGLFNSSLHR